MIWPSATTLETARFLLEPLTPEHADEMIDVLSPKVLYTFTGGQPPTNDELRAQYVRQSVGQSPAGDEGWLNWVIRRPQPSSPGSGHTGSDGFAP